MELSKELARDARKKGICKEWYDELHHLTNKDAMIRMYLKGIDFCLSNEYPDNDFIRKHFKGNMEKFGVFLDDAIEVSNKPKCVCLGGTSGRIEVDNFNVCEVFSKHESALNIIAKDNAFVMVDVFDNAVLNVYAHDNAKVCANHYGGYINTFTTSDNCVVKIIEKYKKTY